MAAFASARAVPFVVSSADSAVRLGVRLVFVAGNLASESIPPPHELEDTAEALAIERFHHGCAADQPVLGPERYSLGDIFDDFQDSRLVLKELQFCSHRSISYRRVYI